MSTSSAIPLASQTIAVSGPRGATYHHGEIVEISQSYKYQASGATGDTSLYTFTPSKRSRVALNIGPCQGAIIESCDIELSSGPGSWGRRIVITAGSAPSDFGVIRTQEDIARLPSCVVRTFGGASDPSPFSLHLPLQFDDALPPILKSRITNVFPVLYLHVSGEAVGSSQALGAWLFINVKMRYTVYGGLI
jgi:hypothetical protein